MVRSILAEGVPHHKNPVPDAAAHHGIVASSAIMGIDPATGDYPADKEQQVALAFAHLRKVMAAAEVDAQDVVKFTFFFADKSDRPLVNTHWLGLYPDETARPARHALAADLPPGCILQIEFLAATGRN